MNFRRAALAIVLAAGMLTVGGDLYAAPVTLDRAVVRFIAPETGGVHKPQFVFERELAFQARLEALADPESARLGSAPYRERHIAAALERHIAETILASLRVDPEPTSADLTRQTEAARRILAQRVGGEAALVQAMEGEGISVRELGHLLRRQVRASLYLDRMVTPMLRPSEAELRSIHRSAHTPFEGADFQAIRPALLRWYVARRLSSALASFYENARSRLEITLL